MREWGWCGWGDFRSVVAFRSNGPRRDGRDVSSTRGTDESGYRGAHLRDVDDTRAILDVLIRDARLDPLLDPGDRLLEWWTGKGVEVRWLSIRGGDGFGRREVRGAHPRRTLFFFAASAFSLVGSLNGPPFMFACGLTSSVPRATVWTPDEASLTKASRGRDGFREADTYGASWPKSSEAFHWRQSPGARRSVPRAAAPDARMAKFFSGVFNYVFNELLVDTLANSRAFQRFAVRTDKALREAQASGKLTDVAKAPGEAAKTATEYGRAVWDELTRQAAEMERNAKQKAGGGK